jgi:hypothetical protein
MKQITKFPDLPKLIDKRLKNVHEIHNNIEQLDEHKYKLKNMHNRDLKENPFIRNKRNAVFEINQNNEIKPFFPKFMKNDKNERIKIITYNKSEHIPFNDLTVLNEYKAKKHYLDAVNSTIKTISTIPTEGIKFKEINDYYIFNNSIYDKYTLAEQYKSLGTINSKLLRTNKCYNYSDFSKLKESSYITEIKKSNIIENILEVKNPQSIKKQNKLLITQLDNSPNNILKDTINSEDSRVLEKVEDKKTNIRYDIFSKCIKKINAEKNENISNQFQRNKSIYKKINNKNYLLNLAKSNKNSDFNKFSQITPNKKINVNEFKKASLYLNNTLEQLEVDNGLIQNSMNYDSKLLNKFTRKKMISSDIVFHKYNEKRDYLGYNKHKLSSQTNIFKTLNPDTALRLLKVITEKFQFSNDQSNSYNCHSNVLLKFENQIKNYNKKINKANSDFIYDFSKRDLISQSLDNCISTKNRIISKIKEIKKHK